MFDTTQWPHAGFHGGIRFAIPPSFQPVPRDDGKDSLSGNWESGRAYITFRSSFAPGPRAVGDWPAIERCLTSASGSRLLVLINRDSSTEIPYLLVLSVPKDKIAPEWDGHRDRPFLSIRLSAPDQMGMATTLIQSLRWPAPPDSEPPPDSLLSACRSDAGEAAWFLGDLREVATDTSGMFAERRKNLGLPMLRSPSEVQQITSGAICERATAAFDSLVAQTDSSNRDPHRRIYLYQYGKLYVVGDPFVRFGEWFPLAVFDRDWKQVGGISF